MSLSSDALYRLQRARSSWASAAAGWAEQRAVGSSAVSRVCSTRGAALERAERPWETEGAPDDDGYPTSLAEPCRRLAAAADSLHEQLERLQAATDTLTALGRLEEARAGRGDSAAGAAPAVTTWDASRCAAAASRLLPLYTKETEVKRTVASWLAHADSAAALTALRAAWMHDAYLTEETLALQQCLGGEVALDAGGGGTPQRASPAATASPALRQRRP
ncbi:hypothetical protein FJT64_016529 [Amphibalanus amphitrite]|uniref:Uncharacterized protein n=1 Tax=Amphibalanus amphitrite TaxID=1232801 RepID=A0A6A4XE50_AMPAM|nr:hypothetical protein FJT64_016529 [Amphibalanus amphitrite]